MSANTAKANCTTPSAPSSSATATSALNNFNGTAAVPSNRQPETENLDLSERHHPVNRVKQHTEPKSSPRGRFGWVRRLMQGQGQGQAQSSGGSNGHSQSHANSHKNVHGRRVRNGGASAPGAVGISSEDNVASYNNYYGNNGSGRKNSASTFDQVSGKTRRASSSRHTRSHSSGRRSTALLQGQYSAASDAATSNNSFTQERYDGRSEVSENSAVSFNDGDGRSVTSGLSSFESNDIDSDNVSTIPLKSITLGTSTATREPSILSTTHRPNSHYVHYSHHSTAATINTAATSTSTASITQGLGIDGYLANEPSTAPSILTNALTVPSVNSPLDTESIITLASSSRRMRRRSIDTNCSTNGIPPASIFERLSVHPRENARDSDAYTTTTGATGSGGGSNGARITATTTNASTPSSSVVHGGNLSAHAASSHASTSKPGSLYASSVITSNNESVVVNESPATASLNETSVGA